MPDEKRKPIIHVIPARRHFKRLRVALYCRVSTQMERQLQSLSAQMDFEKEDILENPAWEYVGTYTDIKSGRTISSRPGFQSLLADCEAGKIDMIYTKSISRFGRNCVDFLVTLRRLKELKVDVFFYNEQIHLLSQAGELLLTLHAGIAQAESENKSENIKWGLRRSTMDPDSPAFSRRCYGYDRNEEEGLILNIAEARIVLKIFDWYEQGWSIVRIKKELEALKVPTPTGKKKWPVKTIENILTNEKYTGTSVYGETESADFPSTKRTVRDPFEVHRSRNHHIPIIHERQFKRVQKLKAKRSNIELDEHGNKVRKSTHYSSKKAVTRTKKTTKPQN